MVGSEGAAAQLSWNPLRSKSFYIYHFVCAPEEFPTYENAFGKILSNKTIFKGWLERENSENRHFSGRLVLESISM